MVAAALLGFAGFQPAPGRAQKVPNAITKAQLTMAQSMLENVRNAVKDNYYDPAYHGVDLEARYEKYRAELEHASTLGAGLRIIAAFLSGFNDSHTFFLPPPRSYDVHYGYRMQVIGDRAFITAVRPGSDAAKQLHVGDEIVTLEGYAVNRKDLWPLSYDLNALEPRGGLHFVLRSPDGATRQAVIRTKFVEHGSLVSGLNELINYSLNQDELDAKIFKLRWATAGQVFVWKLPNFEFDPGDADAMLDRARKYPALVLDLRGNPGGEVDDLKHMLGYFLTKKITIANRIGRHHHGPEEASPSGDHYSGKLFVLVDSGSASAAELFARTVQLNHLGTVVGDTTAGAVMEAEDFPMQYGDFEIGTAAPYGASITISDLIMPDGHSLEKVGVTPDVEVLPTAADLAAGRDTVLARAVQLAGGSADPAALAKAFPVIWAPYRGLAN